MKIWVSSLARVHEVVEQARPDRVVSLLSPGDDFPALDYGDLRHHKLHLHDIRSDLLGHVAPSGDHVRSLIGFLEDWRRDEPLLIHCWAGISRSTAAAFIAACLHNPGADEAEIALALREASPTAWPNTRIVELADEMLNRRGRMRDAIERMGRGEIAMEAIPFAIPAIFGARDATGRHEKGRPR
jgi:predicted protein tyrosine phosphatase